MTRAVGWLGLAAGMDAKVANAKATSHIYQISKVIFETAIVCFDYFVYCVYFVCAVFIASVKEGVMSHIVLGKDER